MARTSRFLFLAALACALLATPASASTPPCPGAELAPSGTNAAAVRTAVLCLHNQERTRQGLPALRENARLRRAAEAHSAAMVARRFFEHTAPGGPTLTDRVRRTGYLKPKRAWTLGENIGWGSGTLASAQEIHLAWMRSPGHRANILSGAFREVGIGIAPAPPLAQYAHLPGATYTTDFGARR